MTEKKAIAEIVAVIATAYPHWVPNERTAEVYWQTLRDLPEAELKAAVLECITEAGRKFAPSIGEIRGKVADIRARQGGIPSQFEAWNEVMWAPRDGIDVQAKKLPDGRIAVREVKYEWSHPFVQKAAILMGWPRFPDGENMAADRARFLECYGSLVERAQGDDMRLPEVKQYFLDTQVKRLEAK